MLSSKYLGQFAISVVLIAVMVSASKTTEKKGFSFFGLKKSPAKAQIPQEQALPGNAVKTITLLTGESSYQYPNALYQAAVKDVIAISQSYRPKEKTFGNLPTIDCALPKSNGLFMESNCEFQEDIQPTFSQIYAFAELIHNQLSRNQVKYEVLLFVGSSVNKMKSFTFPNYPSLFSPNSVVGMKVYMPMLGLRLSFLFHNVQDGTSNVGMYSFHESSHSSSSLGYSGTSANEIPVLSDGQELVRYVRHSKLRTTCLETECASPFFPTTKG